MTKTYLKEQIKHYAQLYENGKDSTNEYRQEIDILANWINNEFQNLCDTGLHIEFVDFEPYTDNKAMNIDVLEYGRLKISTRNNKSIFDENTNLMFRAIHDYHHVINNYDFSFTGEARACIYFTKLFPYNKEIRQILFSEITLQAAYFLHYGKFGSQKLVIVDIGD